MHVNVGMDLVEELSKDHVLSEYIINEIKCGAYIVVEDSGYTYDVNKACGKKRIWCEHTSSKPVYDVTGTSGTVLFGKTKAGNTWVQWERSAYCTCSHLRDWFMFCLFEKNQGPEGDSNRTEHNPIVIKNEYF